MAAAPSLHNPAIGAHIEAVRVAAPTRRSGPSFSDPGYRAAADQARGLTRCSGGDTRRKARLTLHCVVRNPLLHPGPRPPSYLLGFCIRRVKREPDPGSFLCTQPPHSLQKRNWMPSLKSQNIWLRVEGDRAAIRKRRSLCSRGSCRGAALADLSGDADLAKGGALWGGLKVLRMHIARIRPKLRLPSTDTSSRRIRK